MDTDRRKKTVSIIMLMYFIPLIIAILTLMMVLYFGYLGTQKILFTAVLWTFLLSILPILGITTYVYSFIHRNSLKRQWIWDLGCVNSGIWAVIFFGIFLFQLLINPFNSLVSFASFIYFGYLFSLNKNILEFKR